MKKVFVTLSAVLSLVALVACSGYAAPAFKAESPISVVSREEGSGTRSGFIELFGIEASGADGTRTDMTTKEAIIADKTDVMMSNIAGNPYAVGYISLGSLNGTVKALSIDGVKPTPENVKKDAYKIWRKFNIAVKGNVSPVAQDFIDFILSKEGQAIVVERACIAINENAPAFAGRKPSGKIVVAGSSSVNPVMEVLREAYIALNPAATIEIQMNDSSAGMRAAMEGTCDIGMASRELKDTELAQLKGIAIALDGIAVIVNNDNPTANLTSAQVKSIFNGGVTAWNAVR